MIDQIEKFISLHSLGTLALIVLATLGATQFAKIIARLGAGKRYDTLVIHTTALLTALLTAQRGWADPSGWIVAGLSAYFLSLIIAKYGLRALENYFPGAKKIIQGDTSHL